MERASKLLAKVHFPENSVTTEELACAAWKAAVGKRLAAHARAERLVRSRLIVGVDDVVWQRQLFAMSRMILASVEKHLGKGIVDDIEFRVAPVRRGPQRATSAVAAEPGDEAAQIADPVLRGIYIASRRKALA
jgi:predicted nucleic acid-binding Zn ribbon protein